LFAVSMQQYRFVVAEEVAERLMDALSQLEEVADAVTPDEAVGTLDDASLQVFWRDWPHVSAWAGSLWRKLNEDLAAPARPSQDPELDEVGGSG